jgi:nitroreductase
MQNANLSFPTTIEKIDRCRILKEKELIHLEQIENRRSVRKYQNTKIENEKLTAILESARLAPSGSNTQPWTFIIVTSDETKRQLAAADHQQAWMNTAPVFIVCVTDIRCRMPNASLSLDENSPEFELKQCIRDTSIAISHLLLEAQQQGLGTCWTGWFEQKDVRPVLGIPKDKYVCGIITLGYADEAPSPRPRKALREIVRYEKW